MVDSRQHDSNDNGSQNQGTNASGCDDNDGYQDDAQGNSNAEPTESSGEGLIGGPRKDETTIDPDDPAVPSSHDLASAAQQALDDEVAFILLYQDEPEEIIQRLDRLLERMRAAMTVKGPHQARAIRTVLRVKPDLWMSAYRFGEWERVINLAYSRARDLKDPQLISEVIAEWGKYYSLKQMIDSALAAFEWSADKLDEVSFQTFADDTRRLLLKIDQFNIAVTAEEMSVGQVMQQADVLLGQARTFESRYFEGRIYHTLARYYRFVKRDREHTFMYGQMALCRYLPEPEDWGLVAQLVTTMLTALDIDQTGTWAYRKRLLAFLDDIVIHRYKFNPWMRGRAMQTHAVQYYHRGELEAARRYGLRAWWLHWRFGEHYGCVTTQHVIALAERDMGRWRLAERHLDDVLAQYEGRGDLYNYMLAHFSRAMIPVLQQDWAHAEERLLDSRTEAMQRLSDPDQQQRMLGKIDEQLDLVRQHFPLPERR